MKKSVALVVTKEKEVYRQRSLEKRKQEAEDKKKDAEKKTMVERKAIESN
jgi:hypothetical protein